MKKFFGHSRPISFASLGWEVVQSAVHQPLELTILVRVQASQPKLQRVADSAACLVRTWGCLKLHTCFIHRRSQSVAAYNYIMRGMISILIVAAISLGGYFIYLKQAAPGPGMVATQTISLTGVQNDLMAIAQAERMYFAQNGSYADLQTLQSSGTMNITRTSRDGYTYTVEPSANTFTVTARYAAPPVDVPSGVTPPYFPTLSIDQTMAIHQGD